MTDWGYACLNLVSIKNTLQLSASCSVSKICLTKKPFSESKGNLTASFVILNNHENFTLN